MKTEPTLLFWGLRDADKDCLGDWVDDMGTQAPIHTDLFRLVENYIHEGERIAGLLGGKGIATCTDGTLIRAWRRNDEIVRPLVFSKIAELPTSEQGLWYKLIYRRKLQICFVLPQKVEVAPTQLGDFASLIPAVLARRGKVFSVVARDPAELATRKVLRLARMNRRFSTVPPSKPTSVEGLTVVDNGHFMAGHPVVQRTLLG